MKKRICLLLAVLLILSLAPSVSAAQVVETGSCGDKATYTLYSDGRLVIGGSGAVSRWAFARNQNIVSVKIGDKITELEYGVFEECRAIKSVDFGKGLRIIGECAFMECDSLTEIVIPDNVTSLSGGKPQGECSVGAFSNCDSLSTITFGKGITYIPYGLLVGCKSLEILTIPDHITAIDDYAISFCPRLTYMEIPAGVTSIGSMAFVNDFSLTTVIFRGSAPRMGSTFYCGSFNSVGFYPKDDPSWADISNLQAAASLEAMIPYTLDNAGRVIPEVPAQDLMAQNLRDFRNLKYPSGSSYPDIYSYIINGNYLTAYGDEAFAFQLSDALYGFRPISAERKVVFADLSFGDILYFADGSCVITELGADSLKVAGVDQNETVYYDKVLTKAQVELARSYRTRVGVSPYPGLMDPALDYELTDLPTELPTPEQAYETIIALQEQYPEGYPYNLKNHFYSKTESPVWEENGTPMLLSGGGHGCSAFAFMVSDLCFGNLPARYIIKSEMEYDDLRVGDSLIGFGHQVVVLEVHPEYITVVEGNYNEIIHWGRRLTREEVQGQYDVYSRYPAAYPFTDVPESQFYCDPVIWAVENGVTTGATDTTFNPDGQCQRAQVVTFLWRAAGEPEPTTTANPFVDVKKSDFYYKAVLWAVEQGITTGLDATHFGPNTHCNRAQVVTFLWRAMDKPASDTKVTFKDVKSGQFYTDAVAWALEQEITNGMGGGIFGVDGICNRAQVVTFLYRTYVD